MTKVAVLIVNGFDRFNQWGEYDPSEALVYPWIRLCLEQLNRYEAGCPFEVHVWDNAHLKAHAVILKDHDVTVHRDRPRPLRAGARMVVRRRRGPFVRPHASALDELIRRVDGTEYIVTLDNDAFPIADGWLWQIIQRLEEGATLAGVLRDEMPQHITPFIHVSCLAARSVDLRRLGSSIGTGKDVGQAWTIAVEAGGGIVAPLRRSNAIDRHFLMGGIYGDIVYHQGAGSRRAKFWASSEENAEEEERVRRELRDRAFSDLDGLIAELRGERPGFRKTGVPVRPSRQRWSGS